MIKIVLVLSLIYFTSCQTPSECTKASPKKASDCFSLKPNEGICCFHKYSCPDDEDIVFRCRDRPNGQTLEEAKNQALIIGTGAGCDDSVTKIEIICNENDERYMSWNLKIGMLLILGLLF